MTLTRKEAIRLYEGAKCTGEVALFSSTSREAFLIAETRCTKCPVISLCLKHVNPAADSFTGTCAGRLWYDGTDVTDNPLALLPPVFQVDDVNILIVTALLTGEDDDWSGHTPSTLMAAMWGLRHKFTLNRIAKLSGYPKDHISKMIQAFAEDSPSELRDFIASQSS